MSDRITIIEGDITTLPMDAIVNAANEQMYSSDAGRGSRHDGGRAQGRE